MPKKMSNILQEFNREIDKYWEWKTFDKDYRDYPPFRKIGLGEISFLNEYHVHYSIYHLILTSQPELQREVIVQSMHRKGKETAITHGPYALSDLFCRGKSSYEPASPEKMLRCFVEGEVATWDGVTTSLKERAEICKEVELLVIPGYLRKALEQEFSSMNNFLDRPSLYQEFYRFFTFDNLSQRAPLTCGKRI